MTNQHEHGYFYYYHFPAINEPCACQVSLRRRHTFCAWQKCRFAGSWGGWAGRLGRDTNRVGLVLYISVLKTALGVSAWAQAQ